MVFLVRADSKARAREKVVEFLHRHEGQEWDWFRFGGRYAWSPLADEYKDYITKPGTPYYWNPFRDESVKGKTVKIEFPDGTAVEAPYGAEAHFAIMEWIHKHPEESEIIDAGDPRFFEIIERMESLTDEELAGARKALKERVERAGRDLRSILMELERKEVRDPSVGYYVAKIGLLLDSDVWTNDKHFFDIENETDRLSPRTKREIEENPSRWFLVNVDIHY